MAQIVETYEVPATTSTRTKTVCDLCGCDDEARGSWHEKREDRYFTRREVTIESTVNESYPECGSKEGVAFDCCPSCFEAKVVPALVALGLKIRDVDVSW